MTERPAMRRSRWSESSASRGDYLIRDITLPCMEQGDVVAIPSSGAYAPSMASNYNLNARPPIVLVNDGAFRMIRRRETYEDMMQADVW